MQLLNNVKPGKNHLYHSYCCIYCKNKFLCQCPNDCQLKIISLLSERSVSIWMFPLLFLFHHWCSRKYFTHKCGTEKGVVPTTLRDHLLIFFHILRDTAGNTSWNCCLFQFHLERKETDSLNSVPTSRFISRRLLLQFSPLFPAHGEPQLTHLAPLLSRGCIAVNELYFLLLLKITYVFHGNTLLLVWFSTAECSQEI